MGSHSVDESSRRGSVCVTLLPVMPRNIGMFEAVRYLPKQLLRRIASDSSTISTVHLAFIDRPSLSWFTESSSSSARRRPGLRLYLQGLDGRSFMPKMFRHTYVDAIQRRKGWRFHFIFILVRHSTEYPPTQSECSKTAKTQKPSLSLPSSS